MITGPPPRGALRRGSLELVDVCASEGGSGIQGRHSTACYDRPMARQMRSLVVLACLALLPPVAEAQRPELAKARTLYNERQFDGAIEAATTARSAVDTADAAAIVQARAHLERYREQADPADLSAARAALTAVHASGLASRDRVEFLLALGQSLFLEDDFGAAAEIFESALGSTSKEADLHEALLDWWASAIDRQVATLPRELREAAFARVETRMRTELATDPTSATATYWAVVALRGAGNSMRAWDAAVAGWARARLMGDRTAAFRSDINRLVLEGIIPDRVRPLPVDERGAAEAQLKADWELVKERWR
jgi:tetratricopeptide (TPR) repeat protein